MYTSPDRPGEPPVPDYRWVPAKPDKWGSTNGCSGCAFFRRMDVRCSRVPCQKHPGQVAELVEAK